jgi:transcription elongation GreA/GreB family factor
MDEAIASIIKSRIERTDGLAESVRDDMVLILKENFYSLFAKKRVEPWLDEATLYTTLAGLRSQEAELKELIEIQIPANSRAIGDAASLGDLSENSEWKYAVEERTKLQGRQAKIQDDLTKARVMHPEEVSIDVVNIGTKVAMRRTSGDGTMDVSILGPWDTDLPRRRYSYQTAMAQSLLGKAIGETATLRLEGDEAEYEIVNIEAAEF